jgi:diguanylate cyclase (GGDEF)-like protein
MNQAESWLVPDHSDRARMLDMDRRLQPIRRAAFAVLAVALIATGPWIGYWTLIPLAVAGVLFAIADRRIDKVDRPEWGIFAAWTASVVIIAVCILLGGVAGLPSLAWFAIPVVTLSARFSYRGIALGVVIVLTLMVTVALLTAPEFIADNPPRLVMPFALVLAVAIFSTALMRSDREHRGKAVIDPLTGMLNRKALETRVAELQQQSEIAAAPIGLIVIDIDHFKQVNDTVGHAVGDAVLTDVAYIIRKDLRAFELAYRLGGEEFLVLLPGADAGQTLHLAKRICEAVSHTRFTHNTKVTISCGVAVSPPGETFDYGELFDRADTALYEAKHTGRNRVCAAHRDLNCEPVLADAPAANGNGADAEGDGDGDAAMLTGVSEKS